MLRVFFPSILRGVLAFDVKLGLSILTLNSLDSLNGFLNSMTAALEPA